MSPTPLLRRPVLAGSLVLTATLASVALAAPSQAATIAVPPVRTIPLGTSGAIGAPVIADDGTLYVADGSDIQVWAPSSNGTPDVVKTFSGTGGGGGGLVPPSLHRTGGLAYLPGGSSAAVLDPAQADGPAAPTRVISGPATLIDNAIAVAWTPEGSLWVADVDSTGPSTVLELLRFAPGATGDVAPVQRIAGNRTGLTPSFSGIGGSPVSIAGMPGNGVAAAPSGFDPKALVFTGAQTGNTAPSRTLQAPTPGPRWLSAGVATDLQGRVYIGSGDYLGDSFGRLDVFAPGARTGAAPAVTLAGTKQRFSIPLLPSVSSNGRIAVLDATILAIGGGGGAATTLKVLDPLFTKPGRVSGLAVAAKGQKVTVRWRAASNPSRTPLTYRVVVKKGSRTVVSRTVGATSVALGRGSLPTGTLKVSVTALNVGGSGPAATKSFRR